MATFYDYLKNKYGEKDTNKIFDRILRDKKPFTEIASDYITNRRNSIESDQINIPNQQLTPLKEFEYQAALDVPKQSSMTVEQLQQAKQERQEEKEQEEQLKQALTSTALPPSPIPEAGAVEFTGDTVGTIENLRDAQNASNLNRLMALLGSAGSTIGASIAGLGANAKIAPDTTGFENLLKLAETPIVQLKQQMEQEEADPNSPKSRGLRNLIESEFGVKIRGNASFADLKALFPQLVNLYNAREARKQDLQELKMRLDAQKELLKEKQEAKGDDKFRFEEYKKTLEEIKDIHKENRKTYSLLDEAEKKLEDKLKLIEDAKKQAKEYEKKSFGGTGMFSTVGGLKATVSPELQKLRQTFNELSLQNLAETFAGMSKAVDTTYERRQYESTQPDIKNMYETNIQALEKKKTALQSMLQKIKDQKKFYKETGGFFEKDAPQIEFLKQRESDSVARSVPMQQEPQKQPAESGQVEYRKDKKTGKIVKFDPVTKKFLGYAE